MAIKLGELLVQQGLVTEAQIQEALRAQKQFGGRLGTNLVELGFLTEHALAKLLAEQLRIPAVDVTELEAVPDTVTALLPAGLAEKYKVVPVALSGRRLRLAMADPTDLKALDEVGFITGCSVQPAVAPEVLIAFGLEKYYGVARATRYVRLTGPSEVEFQVVQTAAGTGEAGGGPGGAVALESRADFLELERPEFQEKPYTLKDAARELAAVVEQRDVLGVLERMLASDFERSAIFVVRGGQLVGYTHVGCALPLVDFRRMTLGPYDSVALRRALETRLGYVGPIPPSRVDDLLASSLGVRHRDEVLVLPITVNSQPISVVLAEAPRRGGALRDYLDTYALLEKKMSYAIQMVYLRRRILEG